MSDARSTETTGEVWRATTPTGTVSINRYWWQMPDGTHEVRCDIVGAGDNGDVNACTNLERSQVRELRDQLTALLRVTAPVRGVQR